MEDFERRRFFETLATTPQTLKASLKGLSKKVLLWTPAPGKWSILEILCHMRDMEREAYIERYTRILSEDEPKLPDLNGEAIAVLRAYRSQKAPEVVREWVALRRQTLQLLRKAGKAQWARAGVHATAGRLTMEDLIQRHAVGNDTAHLGQIEAIKRRYAVLERLAASPAALSAALKGTAGRRAPAQGGRREVVDDRARRPRPRHRARLPEPLHADGVRRQAVILDARQRSRRRGAQVRRGRPRRGRQGVQAPEGRHRVAPAARSRTRPGRRPGVHPEKGEITVEQLAVRLADHTDAHLGRIKIRG
jgi:uncharacterized damage-inducible protein DinB